jgi:hypothetical protein
VTIEQQLAGEFKFCAAAADKPACEDPANQEECSDESNLAMILTAHGRLTILSLAAILSGLLGCSAFKEKVTPKLNAEVTSGPPAPSASAAKFVVEIRPEKGKAQAIERALTEQTHVQAVLDQSGALKKFKRAAIEVYRPLPSGGWHKMNLEFDKEHRQVPPEYDYAILPGDRIIITEDTTTAWDDVMETALRPLGITPPKKPDPVKQKYQIQG